MNASLVSQKSLILQNITLALEGNNLLQIDETVEPGNVLTIMGPSGSGKSSLLYFIAGFLSEAFTSSGKAYLGEVDLLSKQPENRELGLLFQDALLFPHMSVGQNLGFAIPRNLKLSRQQKQILIEEALHDAGLSGLGNRDPETLSGGQKSRIALMRVLLAKPKALLLDEPFSKLDTALRQQIREFVFFQAKKQNLPTVLVTHDHEDALTAGGKIINLSAL